MQFTVEIKKKIQLDKPISSFAQIRGKFLFSIWFFFLRFWFANFLVSLMMNV